MKQIKIIGLCKKFLICVIVFFLILLLFPVSAFASDVLVPNKLAVSYSYTYNQSLNIYCFDFISGSSLSGSVSQGVGSVVARDYVTSEVIASTTSNISVGTMWGSYSPPYNFGYYFYVNSQSFVNALYGHVVRLEWSFNSQLFYNMPFSANYIIIGSGSCVVDCTKSPNSGQPSGQFKVAVSDIKYNLLNNVLTAKVVSLATEYPITSLRLDIVDIWSLDGTFGHKLSDVVNDWYYNTSTNILSISFFNGALASGSHSVGFTAYSGSRTYQTAFTFNVDSVPSQGLQNYEVFWQLNPTNSSYRTGNFLILYNYGSLEEEDFNYNNVLEAKNTNNPENLTNNSWCIVGISNISDPHDDGEFGVRWFSYSTWEAHANIVGASDNYQAFIAIRNNNGDIVYLTYDFTFDASGYGIFDNNGNNTGTGEVLPNDEKTWIQKIWSLINDFFNMIKLIFDFIVSVLTAFGSIVVFLVSGVIASLKFVIGTFSSFFSVVSGYQYSYVSISSIAGNMPQSGFFPFVSVSSLDTLMQTFISDYIRSSLSNTIFSVVAVILFIEKYVIKRGDES